MSSPQSWMPSLGASDFAYLTTIPTPTMLAPRKRSFGHLRKDTSTFRPLPRLWDRSRCSDDATCPLVLEATSVCLQGSSRPVIVHRPASIEAALDYYIDNEMLDRDPYWCRLWPAAFATTRLMEDFTGAVAAETRVVERLSRSKDCPPRLGLAATGTADWIQGCHVVDFGCGLGLPGIVAALKGAERVDMIDREELALECVRRSAVDNQVYDQVNLIHASWNQSAEDLRERISAETDVILAADIIYEKDSIDDVANVISVLLRDTREPEADLELETPKLGRRRFAIVADPPERTASNRYRFQEICTRKYGLEIVQFTMRVSVPDEEACAKEEGESQEKESTEDIVMMIIFPMTSTQIN